MSVSPRENAEILQTTVKCTARNGAMKWPRKKQVVENGNLFQAGWDSGWKKLLFPKLVSSSAKVHNNESQNSRYVKMTMRNFKRCTKWSGLKKLKLLIVGGPQATVAPTLPWPATLRCSVWRRSGQVPHARPWVCCRWTPATHSSGSRNWETARRATKTKYKSRWEAESEEPTSTHPEAGKRNTPPRTRKCACALLPSVRLAGADKPPGSSTFSSAWLLVTLVSECLFKT